MTLKFVEEFGMALEEVERDEEVRVVVLTGAGRAFSSGADPSLIRASDNPLEIRKILQEQDKNALRIFNMKKPVIAAVNGIAAGCGMNVALAADIIIASEEARFSEIFARIGLLPDMGGLYTLPRLVGLSKAKELAFTADIIDAKEAERIGMVSKVVPADQLESTVRQLAGRLAKGAAESLEFIKAVLNKGLNTDIAGVCEYEIYALPLLIQSEDAKEGLQAFLEKREPKFKGR